MRVGMVALIVATALALPVTGAYGTYIGEPVMVDAIGIPIVDHVNVNQKLHIAANIFNDDPGSQKFVYIVQITDEQDRMVLLKWFSGEINSGQHLSTSISWIPTAPGVYTAEVFLWDGLQDQNALDESKKIVITIS